MLRILTASIFIALTAMPAAAQSCRTIGTSYFCSDGQSGQTRNAMPKARPGIMNDQLSNNRYSGDATNAEKNLRPEIAPQPSGTTLGQTTYGRDGTSCTRTNNRMSCD